MNFRFMRRGLLAPYPLPGRWVRGLAGLLLGAGLAGCAATSADAPAAPAAGTTALPVAAPALAEAPAPAPAPGPAAPATRTQTGRVLDESGHPLVGATVLLRGTTRGTSTDATGSYALEVPAGENTFSIGYGGYQDETAVSRDAQPLTVTLLPTPGNQAKGRRDQ